MNSPSLSSAATLQSEESSTTSWVAVCSHDFSLTPSKQICTKDDPGLGVISAIFCLACSCQCLSCFQGMLASHHCRHTCSVFLGKTGHGIINGSPGGQQYRFGSNQRYHISVACYKLNTLTGTHFFCTLFSMTFMVCTTADQISLGTFNEFSIFLYHRPQQFSLDRLQILHFPPLF